MRYSFIHGEYALLRSMPSLGYLRNRQRLTPPHTHSCTGLLFSAKLIDKLSLAVAVGLKVKPNIKPKRSLSIMLLMSYYNIYHFCSPNVVKVKFLISFFKN